MVAALYRDANKLADARNHEVVAEALHQAGRRRLKATWRLDRLSDIEALWNIRPDLWLQWRFERMS